MRTALLAPFFCLAIGCDKTPAAPTPTAEHTPATTSTPAPMKAEPPAAAMPNPELPAGHPPIQPAAGSPSAAPMANALPAEEGVARPLPLEGSGSVAELKARLAKITDTAKHSILEDAFRKTFTVDRPSRDIPGAEQLLTPLAADPDPAIAALAERTLGYVRVSSGFDQEGAKARYAKAIALDPDYGEAHYAMAFMLAMGDRAQGKIHFDRAIELGVPDNRGLREQFYGVAP